MAMSTSARRARRAAPRPRTLVRFVHLWLGLTIGALFALLGATGSALVFYVGIDAALHPAVRGDPGAPGPGWDSPVWDRALATARGRWPSPGDWSFEATGEGGAIPARHYPSAGRHGHHAPRMMVWFTPDGRRIVRAEPWGGYAMSWIYELHMHLLAGETGRRIVGWSGVAMLALLATGLVAWWPRGGWRKALAFKRAAAPIRRLRDLHKLAGLSGVAALGVLVATGILLALPEVKAALLAPAPPEAPRSGVRAGPPITIARALAAAHRALPDARLAFVDVPGARDGAYRVRVQVPGDPHRRFPAGFIFVDRYSGRILAIRDARRGAAGARLAAWVRPLHDGSAGALAGRAFAALAGLFPTFLFATGLLHWRRRSRRRAAAATPHSERDI